MIETKYSAGQISQAFWFIEMKKIIELIMNGKSDEEIRKLCVEGNLFGVVKEYRSKRIYGYLMNRLRHLDKTLIEMFDLADLQTQKLINLVAILRSDRLFFEFVYELYRDKNIIGAQVIGDDDTRIFIRNKESQNAEIEAWSDGAKSRLRSTYCTYLVDANLLTIIGKNRVITPPIMDKKLEAYLNACGDGAIVKAITGVN